MRFDALDFAATSGLTGPLTALSLSLADSAQTALSSSFQFVAAAGATLQGQSASISAAGITGGLQLRSDFRSGQALFRKRQRDAGRRPHRCNARPCSYGNDERSTNFDL